MRKLVMLLGIMSVFVALFGLALHIYTITQVWGSGFWTTTLTIIGFGVSDIYWAFQWWHGLGWNYSSVVLILVVSYLVLQLIGKLLAKILGLDKS